MRGESRIEIVHLADTHLGYSAYRKIDSDGMNVREKDVYKSFIETVDKILENRPDLVIHAGDLFDTVRPTNRAISVAMEQLIRLSRGGIPTVVIAGNHETPKLRETGHIFKLFDHLENIYPVYNEIKRIDFEIKGKKISVHAVPHCREKEIFTEYIKSITPNPSSDYNILVTHGAVQSIQIFKMNEFNEYIIPLSSIVKGFDYVALGHYHGFTRIRSNIVYSGSTERMSFTEANQRKGFVRVQLSPDFYTEFIPIQTRKMIDFPPIDCKNLDRREIMNKIRHELEGKDISGAIVRLSLINIDPDAYRAIDVPSIKELFSNTLHFEIRRSIGDKPEQTMPSDIMISDLMTEFEKFLDKTEYRHKRELLKLGKRYIQDAEGEGE